MIQDFDLPLTFKGKELSFPAALEASRFSHKFVVDVYGVEISFEPDEERNYRALVEPEMLEKNRKLDVELLQAIAEAIKAIVK